MENRRITIKDMFSVLFKKEFYLDILIMLFVCVSSALGIAYLSLKIDARMGLEPFIKYPYNLILFLVFSITGITIIWRSYTYLVIFGQGSPCPQLGGTKKLVTFGPYSLVRHPSVIGKLLGIIALGCLIRSSFFTFAVIPLLFIWSIFYNRFIQERGCVKKFGVEYLEYRKKVPMFLPKIIRYKLK